MPLKGRKEGEAGRRSRAETIWDAQQGGLATIVRLGILAHRVEVMDAFYNLVEERRMEHTYLPCYEGGWGFHILNVYAVASAET